MLISYWSSDVCSSDLEWRGYGESGGPAARRCGVLPAPPTRCRTGGSGCERSLLLVPVERRPGVEQRGQKIDRLTSGACVAPGVQHDEPAQQRAAQAGEGAGDVAAALPVEAAVQPVEHAQLERDARRETGCH